MKKLQALFLAVLYSCVCLAQSENRALPSQVVVPRLIRFTGQLAGATGTVGVTFTLYNSQNGNAALWTETQNVAIGADGKYTVLIGITQAEGIPVQLFTSGEAQWLGVRVEGRGEQPRVLLVSVPYALKAAEAETLAGHAATEFVTADKLSSAVQQEMKSSAAAPTTNTPNLRSNALSSTATNFTDTTSSQVVLVTQNGTGAGLSATALNNNAIRGTSAGIAILGTSTETTGAGVGVNGKSASTAGAGVNGVNTATTGSGQGVKGNSASPGSMAVYGSNSATTGNAYGVVGQTASNSGTAVVARAPAASGKLFSGQTGNTNIEMFSVDDGGNVNTNSKAALPFRISGSGVLGIGSAADQNLFVGIAAGAVDKAGQGVENTFMGYQAGASSTTGSLNTFVGNNAGQLHVDGLANTFVGATAGNNVVHGGQNTAVGRKAGGALGLGGNDGYNNTFLGSAAGSNLGEATGTSDTNIMLGAFSGSAVWSGTNNIDIGNVGCGGPSSCSESSTIRIGGDLGYGLQTATYIAGINGADASSGVPVYITSAGQLGTAAPKHRLWLPIGNCAGSTPYPLWSDAPSYPGASFTCATFGNNKRAEAYLTAYFTTVPGPTQAVQTHWAIPTNWDGSLTLRMKWIASAGATEYFLAGATCTADGSAPATTPTLSSITPATTFGGVDETTTVTVDMGTCNAGDNLELDIGQFGYSSDPFYIVGAEITFGTTN